MVIFLNGSINAGKTTVGRELAKRLGFSFIELDDIRHAIDEPDIDKAVPLVFELAIKQINERSSKGDSIVVAYPLGKQSYENLKQKLIDQLEVVTLSPPLKIALSNRGLRVLSEKERQRIMHHYEIGIPTPEFGYIVDNSEATVDETVERVLTILENIQSLK